MKFFLSFIALLFFSCALDASHLKLSHVVYYVKDVQESLDFYERAFDLKTRHVDERGLYGELECGGYTLAFANEKLAHMALPEGFHSLNPDDKPFGCEIGFITDDTQKWYEKALEEGAISVCPPEQKPWGQIIAYVRDPQGILIEFCQIIDKVWE